MNIFFSILFLFFWSAVFSFIPSVIYLIINPLESFAAEKLSAKNIFVIKKEISLGQEKRRRNKGICIIYAVCFVFMVVLSLINWVRSGEAVVAPIDILSTISVILFCFAVLTYSPIVLYLVFKDPLRYKDEGVYLRRTFVGYGICIALFSMVYAHHWLKNKGILVGAWDLFSSLFICIFSAACLSYLPILVYILIKSRKPGATGIRPSIIFVVFVISFLLFSGLYVKGWIADRNAGVKRAPLSFYSES